MIIRLSDLVARSARRTPGAPALTARSTTISYTDLHERTELAAARLRDLGLDRGERIAVFLDKRIETVVAMLACSRAGGVFVPVNPVLRARQVRHILDDCAARVLVTSTDRLRALRSDLAACKSLSHILVLGDSLVEDEGAPYRVLPWSWTAERASQVACPATGGVDTDVAAILYTSGSTGAPKGVVLSHRNLVVGAESVSTYLNNTADDRILAVLPLSFDAGLSQLTTGFCVGAQVVLADYLLPGDVVRLCAEHRITGLVGVPPLWIQLAAQTWPSEAVAEVRYFANTGGRLPRVTLQRLRAIFPTAAPYLMYGLTEAFRSTYLDPREVDRRPDSIGKAIPNAEILVVREDGGLCGPGEPGELVHRGPLVALGYWNDAERTAERFRPAPNCAGELCRPDVAVWSGDVVVRDEWGFLYFVGRRDDMIKTSGYRVSPQEIEEVAYETGLIQDAVALGLEDETLGHRIVLVVTPCDPADFDPAALNVRLRQVLPAYMVPAEVLVRGVLPRSPNGKFDRALLRHELMASRSQEVA
ncbi:acyl-CoA ligase (AMP-forming), exosortase A system-associated [Pseudonocardia charpentierae]|uniref:Acyl-CoA ligase (AMP-forming), exosortase A system-associated n=1 Tax=Pseudonocardia charpentierae TaxID=3075545 RepID=A0ABU2NCE3_9PSEU|nr:acyl-CoA ligase (AMP-forming), exosortase A system-associated [Pseudonocardia sp. DSM 45834]MDT0351400.1 acyl-CoA ligase (AMP-forming), exosortase A system-associated [Pseudonocardia sp. DSM 45834]